jgi:hypothetical protein
LKTARVARDAVVILTFDPALGLRSIAARR